MHRFTMCAAVALCSGSALASINLTFDDPGTGAEFTHVAPGGPGGTGDMTFRNDLPVDLELTGNGTSAFLGTQNYSAFFVADFEVGEVTSNPALPFVQASIGGSFSWVDANTNEVILSGTFVDAAVITFGISGTVITSSDITGGALAYTAGQPLIDQGVTTLVDPQDAVWTLTNIVFDGGQQVVDFGSERFINSFNANVAFTGSVEIPAPGAVVLAGFAGVAAVRRRR